MAIYTTLSGRTLEYEPTPELAAFIERLAAMTADPDATEDDMVLLAYGPGNPMLNQSILPGRAMVTGETLANPAYHVAADLLFRKHVAEKQVDIAELAGQHTLSVAETAERLGVNVSAVRQAIDAWRLAAWKKNGKYFVDPRSLATFRLIARGPKPTGRPAERASTDPLVVRVGSASGVTMHVKHPSAELGPAPASLPPAPAKAKTADGTISPWRRVAVYSAVNDKPGRLMVLEPAEDENELALGPLFVRGKFAIAEKVNNARQAREVWEAFKPA